MTTRWTRQSVYLSYSKWVSSLKRVLLQHGAFPRLRVLFLVPWTLAVNGLSFDWLKGHLYTLHHIRLVSATLRRLVLVYSYDPVDSLYLEMTAGDEALLTIPLTAPCPPNPIPLFQLCQLFLLPWSEGLSLRIGYQGVPCQIRV